VRALRREVLLVQEAKRRGAPDELGSHRGGVGVVGQREVQVQRAAAGLDGDSQDLRAEPAALVLRVDRADPRM
jgi:hypothetical protein